MSQVRILLCLAALWLAVNSKAYAGSYPTGGGTQNFGAIDGTVELQDGSAIGSEPATTEAFPAVGVYAGALRLAAKGTNDTIGSFKIPDLDPGNVIKSFDLKFVLMMATNSETRAGEGFSINFGKIPNDDGTGEGGFAPLPHGLTVSFDVANTVDDPSAIQVLVGGINVATFPRVFALDGIARAVAVHWDGFGLDLSFDGKIVFSDLPIPGFSPGVGDRFAFSARTTDATMDVRLDNISASTQALPVLDTGGPIISEFVANNAEFEDEFASKPGWIELFNGSPQTLDLTGWFLTDSKKNLMKWRIAGLTLTPYNYQVAFASGRDRQLSTTGFLHTSFSLAKSGGYVALVRPDGTVASGYEYGPQDKNVSYGEQGANRVRGYMFPASPGVVNSSIPASASFSPEVQFSHPGGFITSPVTVTLALPDDSPGEIRYTLDRSEPTPTSPLYSSPLVITQLLVLKARSYSVDHLPGRVTSRPFVMIDKSLSSYAETGKAFESNLPLIYLDSFGVSVDGSSGGLSPYRPTYAIVVPPDPITGRASLTNAPKYIGPSGAHVRGESSSGFDQKSYALEIWDEEGKDRDASLAGMPADSDWILYGPWSEKTLMRNKLIFDWMIALRGYDGTAVRTRFVELFFNQAKSTQVGFGSYRGVYVLMEKMKRGKDRVPLENLNEKTVDPDLITGGYIIRKDKPDSRKNSWVSNLGVDLQSFDPDRMNSNQLAYVKGYITRFEQALNGSSSRDFVKGYQAYIDPDTFIDAQWMLEVAKQVDGYVFSTYWHKDRGGRLRAGPLWDFNIALGNADYGTGDTPTGWLYGTANGVGQIWYPKLHADPEYRLAHWDRYWEMRRSILSTEAVMAKITENMRLLLDGYTGLVSNRAPASVQNPVARQFRRWPRLGSRDWPNPPAETSIKTWQAEVGYMTNWLVTRLSWLDDQSMRAGKVALRPPVLSHSGGNVTEPLNLTLTPYQRSDAATTFPAGDIYYTVDNSDPRLQGGAISPSASKYSNSVPVLGAMTLKARLLSQQQWSPLASATFFFDSVPANSNNLVVSELMFLPAPLTVAETNAALVTDQGFEFLELRNITNRAVDLTGVKLTRGLTFDFTSMPPSSRLLRPGESVVLVSDRRAFRVRYPQVAGSKVVGQFRGHLDSGGETIAIEAADGAVVKEFKFDNGSPWPTSGETGHSIVLKHPATNEDPSNPLNWTLSARVGGTPGQSGVGAEIFDGDPQRDSDGDGLSDFFEFISGSDAENPNSGYPLSVRAANGQVEFSYRRNPALKGLRFSVETSADLTSWTSNFTADTPKTNLDGTITETFRSAGSTAIFYRLKAEQP